MVSFTPTDEQEMLVGTVRRYAEEVLQKGAHENDETGAIPHDEILKGWEIGLLPASIPETLGGFGEYSAVTNILALEELAFGDLSAAVKLMVPSLFAFPVLWYGTDEQKARFLPLFCEETPYPATAAFIEPRIQFDPLEMCTTVQADDGHYILNGEKAYVPLIDGAEWVIVYARDTETGKTDGYLVEISAVEGLHTDKREKLMGLNALDLYRVKLNNVRVDAACKLGGENGIPFQQIINHSHTGLAAMAVGVARASYEYALEYAKQRVQFGKPIATKQAIAFMLAESRIEIDGARLLAWDAAWQIDAAKSEDSITQAAYLAKHYADKAVLFVTDNGLQTLGGHGFIREYPVERYLRNGRGFPMFTGLVLA